MPTLRKKRAKINRFVERDSRVRYDKLPNNFDFVFTEGIQGYKSSCSASSYKKAKPLF